MQNDIFTIGAKLGDLFPADDPASSWLIRLAILRDDFEYEVIPKGGQAGEQMGAWLGLYQLRKLAITIAEVKNIFAHDLEEHLKQVADRWPAHAILHLREGA